VHGAAPDKAGGDKANPLAGVLWAALRRVHSRGAPEAARAIRGAVEGVLADGDPTARLGGSGSGVAPVGCRAMGDLVLARLGAA
jgi:isocitrate/isopropylmalate dehydrogenase